MSPKLLSSLITGSYAVAISACVVCLIWVAKALIFSHPSVMILTLLAPGVITSAITYNGWDDWVNLPKVKILTEDEEDE